MSDWEMSYIRGNHIIEVDDNRFAFELVMRSSEETMTTFSRVKAYPIYLKFLDEQKQFTQMPASNSSYNVSGNKVVVIPYLRGIIKDVKSLTLDELNDRELQLSRHIVILERMIRESYLPEILTEFERQNAAQPRTYP